MKISYTKQPRDGDTINQRVENGYLSIPTSEYANKRKEGHTKRLRFQLFVLLFFVAPVLLVLAMCISSMLLCAQGSACW